MVLKKVPQEWNCCSVPENNIKIWFARGRGVERERESLVFEALIL